ncbi:unnamed protein product, partial [Prorocentrum cordatum]
MAAENGGNVAAAPEGPGARAGDAAPGAAPARASISNVAICKGDLHALVSEETRGLRGAHGEGGHKVSEYDTARVLTALASVVVKQLKGPRGCVIVPGVCKLQGKKVGATAEKTITEL